MFPPVTSPRLETPGADVVPVPAATVAMVRDGADGLQTWTMCRVRAMGSPPAPPSSPAAGSIRGTPRSLCCGPALVPTRLRPARSLEAVHPQITLLADGSVRLVAAGAEFLFPPSAGQP
jgi:hypothetical protein